MSTRFRKVTREEAYLVCDRCKREQDAYGAPAMQELKYSYTVTDHGHDRDYAASVHLCTPCVAALAEELP